MADFVFPPTGHQCFLLNLFRQTTEGSPRSITNVSEVPAIQLALMQGVIDHSPSLPHPSLKTSTYVIDTPYHITQSSASTAVSLYHKENGISV